MSIYLVQQKTLKVNVVESGDSYEVIEDAAGTLTIKTLLGPQMGRAQTALAKQDWAGMYGLAREIVGGVDNVDMLDPMVVFLLVAKAIAESKIKDGDAKKS